VQHRCNKLFQMRFELSKGGYVFMWKANLTDKITRLIITAYLGC